MRQASWSRQERVAPEPGSVPSARPPATLSGPAGCWGRGRATRRCAGRPSGAAGRGRGGGGGRGARRPRAPRRPGVVHDQRGVGADRRPLVSVAIRASSHGVNAGPPCRPPRRRRPPVRPRPGRRHRGGPARGTGAHTSTPPPRPVEVHADDRRGRPHSRPRAVRDSRRPGEEPWQLRLADRDDRHAPGLEVLERGGHIEDGLGSRTHDRHRGPAELLKVR